MRQNFIVADKETAVPTEKDTLFYNKTILNFEWHLLFRQTKFGDILDQFL